MRFNKTNDYTRRGFLKFAAAGAAALTCRITSSAQLPAKKNSKEMLVYIGTYTSGKSRSKGIYIYRLNLDSGALAPYRTVKNVIEPSYLAIDASGKHLYAVNETETYEGKKSGAVSAFAIDRKTGDLKFLNRQPSLGGAPCYITVSGNEKFVLIANYSGGSATVFPVEADGKLGAAIDLKQNSGSGKNKERQESAHAHSINLDGKNEYAYLCDLGVDRIFIYQFDEKTGKLNPNPAQEFFQTKAGAGPRHFALHPNGKYAFVVNELDSTVTALARDERRGSLEEIQTVSTLPVGWSGSNTCADIHVSPNGKFLYGSNRGHDSIASYKIDETDGKLELIEHVSTLGKTPRNFVIEPGGRFLLAANQNSNSIVVFRIDEKTGVLSAIGEPVAAPTPVCLKLTPVFI